MRRTLTSVILAVLLASNLNGQASKPLTKKQAESVVKKSEGLEGLGSLFRQGMLSGMGTGIVQMNGVMANWVTEPTSKAVARLVQLAERTSDEQAARVLAQIRRPGTYALLVSSFSATSFAGVSIATADTPDIRTPTTIFLQDKKDKKRFARLKAIEPVPFSMRAIWPKAVADTAVLLIFERMDDKGVALIESTKQEIELEIPVAGRTAKLTFRLGSFPTKKIDEF